MSLRHVQITPPFVQAVRDAVDIVAIASDHTRLAQKGKRWEGLCPLHKEKTPSFSVDPTQNLFYCFGCGTGGDAFKLHMLVSGDDFPAAVESLARRFGVPLPKVARGGAPVPPRDRTLDDALAAAQEVFERALRDAEGPRRYLESRGFSAEVWERWGLGFAPDDWHHLEEALVGRFPKQTLIDAGLLAESAKQPGKIYDRFRNRLIFPIRSQNGRLVGFGGRTLGDDRAKYINTAETERFHKSRLLYGLDVAKRWIREEGRAVLVEGYFDALAFALAGREIAVASMGTSLTEDQARLLARYAEEVVVAYDGDEAGERALSRALPLLLAQGLVVRRLELPAGEDPDSIRQSEGAEALLARLVDAPDAFERWLVREVPADADRRPELQSRLTKTAQELLRHVPDPVLRYSWAAQAARRLGLPTELIWRQRSLPPTPRSSAGEGEWGSAEGAPREVRSLEEIALRRLFEALPEEGAEADWEAPFDRLPSPEVFRVSRYRNIFSILMGFLEDDRPPNRRRLVDELAGRQDTLNDIARLIIEPEPSPAEHARPLSLEDCVARLERRWMKGRQAELAREMTEAEKAGDQARLERLILESKQLSRRLHGIPETRPHGLGGRP